MDFFSSYVGSILTVGICALVCETLCECFSGSKVISRSISIATSLCLFITIIIPIGSAIKKLDFNGMLFSDKANNQAASYQSLSDLTQANLEAQISERILNETGISVSGISIELNEDMQIEYVRITLSSADFSDKNMLDEYLTTLFGKETAIIISETNQ